MKILQGNKCSTVSTLVGSNTSALINSYESIGIIGLGNEAVTVNSG